jgi:hypothetical protein
MSELAEVRGMPGVEPEKVDADAKKRRAAEAKKAFTGKIRFATVSTQELLKEDGLLAAYARGTAVLMFVDILAGVYQPKDAEQAIKVARAALEISREEGLTKDVSGLSDNERADIGNKVIANLNDFAERILQREGIALEQEGK